ncbi:uncharacterized protein RAG0_00173 [Rhynchosporium agropyri]|uniref:Peptidase A1 domain-containing protein n=1 Tax=Rhynchosporium agropyri TaxID=914238 RepID=A0A1E1JRP1_9HELO|nr:uncharacterized protein RAG0_00173 [Rhynchosporium agropyri]
MTILPKAIPLHLLEVFGISFRPESGNHTNDANGELIPTPAFEAFLSITGAQFESRNRVPEWTRRPTANFSITFGSTTYTLTPDQYLLPTDQHAVFGLDPGKYYAFLHDGGTEEYTTIIGQKFLEYYYSVYDETNSRIGFAANS